jgi:7-cyano-7-deazaguanine synthase in queuosine biosynthesis
MRFFRYTGRPRAANPAYKAALDDQEFVILDAWSRADGNIASHFRLNGKRARVLMNAHTHDLFDLAAMVYVADELVSRASGGDQWTRDMEFTLPVFDPTKWEAAEAALVACLGFLSGDRYRFGWLDRPNTAPARPAHRHRLRGEYDAVCLFSGGVDSLLGAVALLAEGQRVLLVSHYADGVTSSAQRDLFALLGRKYAGQTALLQVHVARSLKRNQRYSLPKKLEISHRARSFLFLAIGAVAATAIGTVRLYIPENGLIALNAPLGASRRGTLSTRTAHPRFIEQFNTLLRALGFSVVIANPFGHQSKTDMVQSVLDADIRSALQRSVSCAHAGNLRWESEPGVTHCGYCVPCLYRRAAFLAAGMDNTSYLKDVFTDLPTLSADRARDFRLLVKFARTINAASEIDLVATVLRHGGFNGGPNGEEYTGRAAMLKRWAITFTELTSQRSSLQTRRIVGI